MFESCLANNGSFTPLSGGDIQYYDSFLASTGTIVYPSSGGQDDVLPFDFYDNQHRCLVYNNAIHILGSGAGSGAYQNKHYSWNGYGWVLESVFPFETAIRGAGVVYHNCIHLVGGGQSGGNYHHYIWDGKEWSSITVSDVFYDSINQPAVVYNDKIILLNSGAYKHAGGLYAWDGTTWSRVASFPSGVEGSHANHSRMVVYDGVIHIYGLILPTNNYYHYTWDGTQWNQLDHCNSYIGDTIHILVHNNAIHIFMGSASTHKTWTTADGYTTLYSTKGCPYNPMANAGNVIYNNKFHFLGGSSSSTSKLHYYGSGNQTWSKPQTYIPRIYIKNRRNPT